MFSGCGGWGDEQHVQIDGTVVTFTHQVNDMCGVGLPPMEFAFELGAFPPGHYTLVYAPTDSSGEVVSSQTIGFVVLPSSRAVPASSITTLAVLAAFILMLALRARRWHVP